MRCFAWRRSQSNGGDGAPGRGILPHLGGNGDRAKKTRGGVLGSLRHPDDRSWRWVPPGGEPAGSRHDTEILPSQSTRQGESVGPASYTTRRSGAKRRSVLSSASARRAVHSFHARRNEGGPRCSCACGRQLRYEPSCPTTSTTSGCLHTDSCHVGSPSGIGGLPIQSKGRPTWYFKSVQVVSMPSDRFRRGQVTEMSNAWGTRINVIHLLDCWFTLRHPTLTSNKGAGMRIINGIPD